MAKIIKIDNNHVIIAKDNGEVINASRNAIQFKPALNDIVEIYETEEGLIINKAAQTPSNNTYVTNVYSGKKPVNKVVYALFGIFLGGIEIHKFYAGKIGMAYFILYFHGHLFLVL